MKFILNFVNKIIEKMTKHLLSFSISKVQFDIVDNFFNFKKLLFPDSKYIITTLAKVEK